MNFNKNIWDETEAKEFGEFEAVKLGGHEVVIMDAREYTGQTGTISLKVSVDISGKDKQAGYFKKQYEEAKKNAGKDEEVKWPNGAIRYLSLKDENIAYLKGFITSLEKSNTNFKFDKGGSWEQLKNLKLAGVFGLEEYEKTDGSIGTVTKLVQFRSLEKLSEIEIPSVKTLKNEYIAYEDYKALSQSNSSDEIEITGDMLPF